ncbi:hypothetical protein EUGRSUZ_L00335 [Eucalyptus grandis]|uniref:Uncharacterized protein n=2 Tax=Eucalyptus grandis TaxID=71139 RepID=A0ACC3L637_EUCGR|nr:hypothetical protein EUGRSUZ_L00335 [Eucalyptus grandis]
MKKLHTPKANLAKIEFLACLTAILLMLLTIFGSSRRRHNHQKLRNLLWAAYTLSSYLIVYTLGLMTEALFQNDLLLVWAIFLMIYFGSSDLYSVHSLKDCEQRKNYVHRRAASLEIASRYGRQREAKFIADHMSSEHQSWEGDLDPSQMRGYDYIVKRFKKSTTSLKNLKEREAAAQWEAPNYRKSLKITHRVVTIDMVWNCQGWLLRSGGGDEDSKLKDICLSFSLYKLLLLRFSSYSLPKQAHEKAWKLIQHLYAEGNGYERAFRVVELELSFLFDHFYTKYPTIFQPSQGEVQLATAGGLSVDILVTAIILTAFTCVELVQCFFMGISEWTKVILLCNYVLKNWWQENRRIEKLKGLICLTQFLKPWERKLRQYLLLESYDYTPPSTIAELSSEVKKAVFRSLMANPEARKNGETSLRLNEVEDQLSWACKFETQTQVIDNFYRKL